MVLKSDVALFTIVRSDFSNPAQKRHPRNESNRWHLSCEYSPCRRNASKLSHLHSAAAAPEPTRPRPNDVLLGVSFVVCWTR